MAGPGLDIQFQAAFLGRHKEDILFFPHKARKKKEKSCLKYQALFFPFTIDTIILRKLIF